MRARTIAALGIIATFAGLLLLHLPLLRLPYFWDETGYYIPAALDFYRIGSLIPVSTRPLDTRRWSWSISASPGAFWATHRG